MSNEQKRENLICKLCAAGMSREQAIKFLATANCFQLSAILMSGK
jgi:uncharacterized protein YoaH (UPF0181 family)